MTDAGFILPDEDEVGMDFGIDTDLITPESEVRAARIQNGSNYGLASTLGGAIIGAAPDLVDTVSSSLGFTDRGQINDSLLRAIGSPGLMNFYNENKGAIEVASGIAGVIAADYSAGRFLRPAGAAMRALSGSRIGNRIATLDARYERSLRAVQATEAMGARRGVIGPESFVGDVTLTTIGREAQSVNLGELRRGVRWNAVARGAARNITTEGILAATMNQNSFLFSEDMSENILWMVGGVGLGAFIDRTASIYTMRKSLNRDLVYRMQQRAYDPAGIEATRLRAALMEESGELEGRNISHLGYLQGHYTDRATSYMVSARTLANRELTDMRDLASRRERLGTQQIGLARDETQKATTRGIAGISGTGFSLSSPGLGNHVDMRLRDDPTWLYGVEMLGAPSQTRNLSEIELTRRQNITARQEQVRRYLIDGGKWQTRTITKGGTTRKEKFLKPLTEEQREGYLTEMRQLFFHQSLTPQVSLGREWVPMKVGKLLDGFEEPKIRLERSDERSVWSVLDEDNEMRVAFANDGELFLPKGKTVNNLEFNDHLRLYRASQQAMEDMVQKKQGFILPNKPDWFQLDFAEELLRRTGDEGLVQFPGGMTRQSAQVESFRQKVKAIRGMDGSKSKIDLADPDEVAKIRLQYNLPNLSSYESGLLTTEEHPLEVILRNMTPEKLDTITHTDLVNGIREVRKINGLGQTAKDRLDSIMGDMFRFMIDDNGKPLQPILGYRRPLTPHQWTKDDLAERLAMRKALVRDRLIGPGGGDLTRNLTATLLNEPDFMASSQVQALLDSQLQPMLPVPGFANAAPQTAKGNLLNSVTSKEWRDRDNPVLLAAARIRDKGERIVRNVMRERVEGALGDVVQRVNGPRNMQSRLLLNQYLTFRSGWDLQEKLVEVRLPNGQTAFQFALDTKSAQNQRRWKYQFEEDMPEEAILRTPQGKPIVVDELGREFVQRFQTLSDDLIREKNTILRANGLGKINRQSHYAPPPNMKGKYIGFTLDSERNVVPGGTVIASTPEEFARMKSALETDTQSVLNRNGHVFYTQDELRDFATIWDRAQMNFMDPGTTAIQPGKKAGGKSIGIEINPNALEDALTWVRDSYLAHGDDVMRVLFHDQIHAAETRAQIAKAAQKTQSRFAETNQRSIYDYYVDNLTGRLGITSQSSFVGRQYRSWEDKINKLLAETSPPISRVATALWDFTKGVVPGAKNNTQQEAFIRLRDSMGEYMPFNSAAEMAERMHGAKRPPELAEITGNLSKFEAGMRLRLLEIIHPVMNLSGIINSMPAVVRHMQPMANETTEDFAKRIGHSATMFNLESGRRIGTLDMAKVLHRAFKRAWSRTSDADYEFMMGRGYITQEVAEFQRQFGAIDSKSTWQRYMFGSATPDNRFQQKGLVGHLSTLSDKSEDFSRSWAHFVGLEVADILGITSREARHSLGHEVANKMIANYDPKNRPEIFQGALGAPIGLFQSFIWNYYQRLFRYIETKDARSFATQYAVQGSLFGVTTLPGWNAINKLFFDHSDGENSPYDAIYERFGQETGDVLMGGVISNIPKLANLLPGEQNVPGIDLYSRGDTNIRLPVINGVPPFLDTMIRVKDGISRGISAFLGNHPNLTDNQVGEILSNMLTNRPLAGFIEQAVADGYDTDRYGQVAAESQNAMEVTYRVLGTRSMRQSKELEAFYANRNQQELQGAAMSELRDSVRSTIRAGEFTQIPAYFEEYIQRGGDPARFRRWIRDNFEAATKTRAERQLQDVLDDENAMNTIERLIDAEVQIDESELNMDTYEIEVPDTDTNPGLPGSMGNPANADVNLQDMETDPMVGSRF